MASKQPHKTNTGFEYFLYAAILAETGLAALIYKFILQSAELVHLRVYFAIFYFGFLAWAIAQLRTLHRKRASMSEFPAAEPEVAPSEDARQVLGLTGLQLAIVAVVFATAVAMFSWAFRVLR